MEPHLFRADVLEKRSETSLKNFQGLVILFNYQGSVLSVSDSFVIIPPS